MADYAFAHPPYALYQASWALTDPHCHCEERSDEAIHLSSLVFQKKMDCFTSFAMTGAGKQ
jgi:hypothetical protein